MAQTTGRIRVATRIDGGHSSGNVATRFETIALYISRKAKTPNDGTLNRFGTVPSCRAKVGVAKVVVPTAAHNTPIGLDEVVVEIDMDHPVAR